MGRTDGPRILAAPPRQSAHPSPELRRRSFRIWPSGPRTVYRAPPLVTIEYAWDPESETRDAARAKIMNQADDRLDEIIRSYEAEGYERINVRNLLRDVEAAYLRISDPERWTWKALGERHELPGVDASQEDGGAPLYSASGVRRAVGRVFRLLDIEPPRKKPGRRRSPR